jgi:hypothetical protein
VKATPKSTERWQPLAEAILPAVFQTASEGGIYPSGTPMQFFFALLPAVQNAHRAGDQAFLLNAYAFAHWCMTQPEKELWNPAGVGFYEHIFDELPADAVAPWIAPRVFSDIESLLALRLGEKKAAAVRASYDRRISPKEQMFMSVISRAETELNV